MMTVNDFDTKADGWDKNRMHLERTLAVAGLLRKRIKAKPGLIGLEFGAGTGLLSFQLKDHFSEIVLLDNSRVMLNKAEEKISPEDQKKFRTIFLDLENEEFPDEKFDVIYSQMVLHHVKDIDRIFGKFKDLLHPGGILAIADLYPEDGSFHEGNPDVHFGFEPKDLANRLAKLGFHETVAEQCFVILKESGPGNTREYPVFLLTASLNGSGS
jgi:tRNA (cmo5U34)-methyltransferase